MEEVRETRLDEFDELMAFLARTYGYDDVKYFPTHYPHLYRKEQKNLKNSFIIKDNGKIVSHTGLFPLDVLVGKTILKAGGIGGVSTDPDYRGQGLMRKLLNFTIDKMKQQEYAFSILWGDRQRYGNLGWELGGRRLLFTVTPRSLMWKEIEAGEMRRYDNQPDDLEKIMTFHEAERLKVKRSKNTYQLLMKKAGIQVWAGKESYIILSGEGKIQNAVESGGNPAGILSLTLTLIKEKKLDGIRISRPYENSEINNALLDASSGWAVETLCSIKIANFARTLEGFQQAAPQEHREKYRWPENEKQLVKKLALPNDNMFNFYIWRCDQV